MRGSFVAMALIALAATAAQAQEPGMSVKPFGSPTASESSRRMVHACSWRSGQAERSVSW